MQFVDREWELKTLDQMWTAGEARFLVLYGRRRIGKTRLLTHWLSSRSPHALYWVAKPASSASLLRDFSQSFWRHTHPGQAVDPGFSYPSWEMIWQAVAEESRNGRFALLLDEFTYTLDSTPELAGTLQNAWDHSLNQSDLMLVVSGSHLGMMERQLLAYRAPLYGRASARLLLQQLPFRALGQLFPRYETAERVALYSVLGGIPAYLERFDPERSLSWNIKQRLLTPANLLQEEPRLLLQEQLAEPRNYMALLEAIAHGHRSLSEIAAYTGLERGHVSKYLGVLRNLRLVRRDVPATVRRPERSRKGRYVITDPYLRFYFRFLARLQDEIALGRVGAVWRQIQRHLVDFIGTHTFEELCREWARQEGNAGRLPLMPETVGSFWSKEAQVDVVAVDWMEKKILLGEAKWSRQAVGKGVLNELVEKSRHVVPGEGWEICYALFGRAGFTTAARQAAEREGVLLIDLERLDTDLAKTDG